VDISKLSKLYIDATDDLIFLTTVEGGEPPFSFRFAAVNPAYLRHTGYDPNQFLHRTLQQTLPADVVDFVQERFTEAVTQQRTIKYEEPVVFQGVELIVETTLTPFFDESGRPDTLLGVTRDITERKRSERRVRESEERYRTLVQLSPDSILIHDEGNIVFCNEAYARLVLADRPEALIGSDFYAFLPDVRRAMNARIQRMRQTAAADIPPFETKLVRTNGETIDVEGTCAFVEQNGRKLMQVVLRDVTKRSLEKERLQKLSQLDGLTNVANRRYFDAVLQREARRAKRTRRQLSLLLFDIDNFKKFNDMYGHLEGDDCLRRVTEAAAAVLQRPADVLARYGGEEFAVLLPETDAAGAALIAERLRETVASLAIPHAASDAAPHVTISVGASNLAHSAATDVLPLIDRADRALYQAKRSGKNRVELLLEPADAAKRPIPST